MRLILRTVLATPVICLDAQTLVNVQLNFKLFFVTLKLLFRKQLNLFYIFICDD